VRRKLAALASVALAAIVLAPTNPSEAAYTPACPTVVAHRTNPKAAPENTVAGINSVPATGAQWVEMDPQDSVSGYSVLMHDATVDRTTPGTGTVSEMGLNALTALSATDYAPWNTASAPPVVGSTKVPYAWDYLNAVRANGLRGILDIQKPQTPAGAQKLLEYMDRWPGMRGSLVYMGNQQELAAMRPYSGDTLAFTYIEYPAAGTMRTAEWLREQGATAYALPVKEITPGKVGYYHSEGLQVWTWTSDPGKETAANRTAAREAGVDMLITDEPATAIAECPPLPAPTPPQAKPTPVPTAPSTAPTKPSSSPSVTRPTTTPPTTN
jgi:glycerophosphoryl diester phosphodiesterase